MDNANEVNVSKKENADGETVPEYRETDPLTEHGTATESNNKPPPPETVPAANKRTFCELCRHVGRNITVEPSVACFIISVMITILTTQNLSLDKACRVNLNFTDEICDSLRTQTLEEKSEYEKASQKLLASAMAKKTYITATIPTLLALLVGSWSDKTGRRKIFIIITLIGSCLACINNIINVYFFHQLNLEVLVFSEAILEALAGSWCLIMLTSFSYISAVTTEEERTFRIGLINFSMTVGFPIGMGLSGVLLKNFGYYGCYGIAIGVHLCNLVYNVFWLKDPERSVEQKKHDGQGARHFFKTFFDLKNVKKTIKVIFKDGPNNRRIRICMLLAVVTILFGPLFGEISILYMSTRYRFNWDEVKFSIFQTYNFVTHTVGTIFSITVFSKYLQWHDSVLGIISTLSKIFASFIYCFAPNETIFFIAPMVEILNGTALLALRSIVSKLVDKDELGKVNSIFGLTENLMPLLYVPLYTKVYTATMEVLPGAVFLMGAAMTLPAVFVFIWLLYEYRKQLRINRYIDENPVKEPLHSIK